MILDPLVSLLENTVVFLFASFCFLFLSFFCRFCSLVAIIYPVLYDIAY
jgi:hypothetical protein